MIERETPWQPPCNPSVGTSGSFKTSNNHQQLPIFNEPYNAAHESRKPKMRPPLKKIFNEPRGTRIMGGMLYAAPVKHPSWTRRMNPGATQETRKGYKVINRTATGWDSKSCTKSTRVATSSCHVVFQCLACHKPSCFEAVHGFFFALLCYTWHIYCLLWIPMVASTCMSTVVALSCDTREAAATRVASCQLQWWDSGGNGGS